MSIDDQIVIAIGVFFLLLSFVMKKLISFIFSDKYAVPVWGGGYISLESNPKLFKFWRWFLMLIFVKLPRLIVCVNFLLLLVKAKWTHPFG
jgi:hypothetical protein